MGKPKAQRVVEDYSVDSVKATIKDAVDSFGPINMVLRVAGDSIADTFYQRFNILPTNLNTNWDLNEDSYVVEKQNGDIPGGKKIPYWSKCENTKNGKFVFTSDVLIELIALLFTKISDHANAEAVRATAGVAGAVEARAVAAEAELRTTRRELEEERAANARAEEARSQCEQLQDQNLNIPEVEATIYRRNPSASSARAGKRRSTMKKTPIKRPTNRPTKRPTKRTRQKRENIQKK